MILTPAAARRLLSASAAAIKSISSPSNGRLSVSRRGLSKLRFVDIENDLDAWPQRAVNTLINVCPQGEYRIIERFGRFHKLETGGLFVAIPLVDEIRFCVDMRERTINITAQSSITKDNVALQVSGNLYCKFQDAEKAAYGSKNPIYAVKQHAQSAMRAAIGELELDQILHARAQLNAMIREAVQDAAEAWGLEIKRYEITEITPDRFITEAMDKQAAAERERRKKVLEAEGDKRAAELQSEGQKIRMINESEGELIKIRNEASGNKERQILLATGEAEAIRLRAEAHAQAIALVARALSENTLASEAAKLHIARDYIEMYSDIGQKSNTMIFSDRPADVNALLAQAAAVVSSTAAPTLTGGIGGGASKK